jgi:hypothetical protein
LVIVWKLDKIFSNSAMIAFINDVEPEIGSEKLRWIRVLLNQ